MYIRSAIFKCTRTQKGTWKWTWKRKQTWKRSWKQQSWARAFFGSSRLRFRAPGGTLSRWRFRALFWALNFALLRSRSRAFALLVFRARIFALLDFRARIFALLDFRARIFALLYFRARTFTLLISFRATGFLSHSRFPFAHVCL
jgi:hypothetical protein